MHKKPINTKILLTILVFVSTLIPSCVASSLYYFTEHRSLTRQAMNYEQQFLTDMERSFSDFEERLEKIQYEITSQFVTTNMYQINITQLKEGQIRNIRTMENLLQSIRRTFPGVNNIYIINTSGQNLSYSSTYSYDQNILFSMPWVKDIYNTAKEWTVISPHIPNYAISSLNATQNCVSFVTGLINLNRDDSFEYILQIDVSVDYLSSLVPTGQNEINDSVSLFVNKELINTVDYTPEGKKLAYENVSFDSNHSSNIYEIQNYLFSEINFPDLKLNICKLTKPTEDFGFHNLSFQLFALILLSLIIASLCALVIVRLFISPFEQLIQSTMMGIENTSCLKRVSIECNNSDIFQICEHFNILIDRINLLLASSIEHEKEKRLLQMKMLQAQISPHFLYNTLNSIKWMALMHEQTDIADVITSLVDLLEYCCRDPHSMTRLNEEITFLKNYIYIQQFRNANTNIKVKYNLDQLPPCKILKLSLQPAVENAYLHAFTPASENPEIEISGKVVYNQLIIQIKDNGIGFDTDLIKKNLTGIGIHNVDERIKLTFGQEYGQKIESHLGAGTTVTLIYPFLPE